MIDEGSIGTSGNLDEVGLPPCAADRHARAGGLAALETALSRAHLLPARRFNLRDRVQALGRANSLACLARTSEGPRGFVRRRNFAGFDRLHQGRPNSLVSETVLSHLLLCDRRFDLRRLSA